MTNEFERRFARHRDGLESVSYTHLEYFVPLSWKVIEDMYVLAGELADGMHDKEAHLDTGEEFFARHGSAMLAGSRLP